MDRMMDDLSKKNILLRCCKYSKYNYNAFPIQNFGMAVC